MSEQFIIYPQVIQIMDDVEHKKGDKTTWTTWFIARSSQPPSHRGDLDGWLTHSAQSGSYRDRTDDLLGVNQLLYQLS